MSREASERSAFSKDVSFFALFESVCWGSIAFSESADFLKTTIYLHFGLAILYRTEKTLVAQKLSFSCTFLIKCPGQKEAMDRRIISCFGHKVGFDW